MRMFPRSHLAKSILLSRYFPAIPHFFKRQPIPTANSFPFQDLVLAFSPYLEKKYTEKVFLSIVVGDPDIFTRGFIKIKRKGFHLLHSDFTFDYSKF